MCQFGFVLHHLMLFFAVFAWLTAFTSAQPVTGVFTGIKSITNPSLSLPGQPIWTGVVDWKIDGSNITAGDTFVLTLPCVATFYTTAPVSLSVGSTAFATCNFFTGNVLVPYSQLQCTASSKVTPSTLATGTVSFPFGFNVGQLPLGSDYSCALKFAPGSTTTVSWEDGDNTISKDVHFSTGTRVSIPGNSPTPP